MAETSTPDNSDEYKVSHGEGTGETCPCASVGCALPLNEHRSQAFGERFTAIYAGTDPFPHAVRDSGAPPPPTRDQVIAETRKRLERAKALRLPPPSPFDVP